MSQDEVDYLANYKPDTLYTHPGRHVKGAFATMVGDSEERLIGEIDVTNRCKLAVSAFYVDKSEDFGSIKITKMQFHKTHGWRADGQVHISKFQLSQMKEFLSIISSLDLRDAQKTRIALDNLDVGALGALLTSSKGADLIRELAKSPELHHDIYAVAAKRTALDEFEGFLCSNRVASSLSNLARFIQSRFERRLQVGALRPGSGRKEPRDKLARLSTIGLLWRRFRPVGLTQFTAQPFDEGTSMRNFFVRPIWEKRDLAKRYVVSCT